MTSWTLTIGATTRTLSEWGLFDCRLSLQSQGDDVFECSSVPAALDSWPLIEHNVPVALFSPDGICRFRGTCHNPSLACDSNSWRWHYTCHGPWWDLGQLVFQQSWTMLDHDTDSEVSANGAEIVFGMWYDVLQDESGEDYYLPRVIDTSAMLTNVSIYAATQGLVLPIGSLPQPRIVPPWNAQDISCAAAIQSILRWHPSAVTYFDYAAPAPVLHIVSADSLPGQVVEPTSLDLQSFDFTPRYDLRVTGVIVRYKRIKLTTELKVKTPTGGYVWVLASKVPAGTATYGERTAKYEYVTESSAGAVTSSLRGVLVYSVDWTGYWDDNALAEKIAPPLLAAAAIFDESSGLPYEGSITLQDASCPMVSWGRWSVSGVSGAAITTGINYDLDSGITKMSLGPVGSLGIDWVDLLSRRVGPSGFADMTSASAPASSDGVDSDLRQLLTGFVAERSIKVYDDGAQLVDVLVRKPSILD